MASVDNRVVRMEFDNAAFEARIKQTLTSLSQLDKALKLEGASKGLTDVNAAASRVNLNPLNTAVQSVSTSFLALSTIAVTALSTITSRAITAGTQLAKSLTLEPIIQGFQEYETNMRSIQTILANTKADGTNLEQVNAALDKLNHYSDQTIYNFAEMARNIGTFTAAGVDLDTSVSAIKGIANLAAISGSSSEQAATAMYQLSQAIANGRVALMDWNSVVNAGMGGEVFQKALFETGKAMQTISGVGMDTTFEEWTAAGNSFRDSLQDGWITGEVLTTTLGGISGELDKATLMAKGFSEAQADALVELGRTGIDAATQVRTLTQLMSTLKESVASGWSQTFRTLFGDFNEATQLFTGLNNSIGGFFSRQADARNALVQGWADLGGRAELLQGLENAFYAIGRVLAPIGKAFRDIFPATTAQQLFELTQRFTEFTETLKPSEQTMANIRRIATGLFAALDIGWTTIKAGVGFIKDLIIQLTGLGSGKYLEGASDILDFFTRLREDLRGGAAIEEFFDKLSVAAQKPIQFIHDLKDAIVGFFDGFKDTAGDVGEAGVDRVSERFETLSAVFERLGAIGDVARSALEKVMGVLSTVGEAISTWFGELSDKIRAAIDTSEFNNILDGLNLAGIAGIGALIANFLRGGMSLNLGDGGIFDNISGAFEQLTGTLETMQTAIRADALLKIAGAVGILAASMVVLSLIDSAALTRALVAMAVGFTQLMAAFAALSAINSGPTSAASFAIIAAGLVILSGAMLILSAAVAALAQLSWGELAKGLAGITVLLAAMTGAAILMSAHAGGILLSSVGLVAMAGAIVILSGAVAMLAQLSWPELLVGLGALAAILAVVVGAAVIISKHAAGMLASSVGLTAMGIAINILAGAVAILGNMDLETLGKGIGAIAIMLALLVAAAVLLSKHVAGILATSVALIALSASLTLIAGAMQLMGSMSWGEIAKGLVALAGAMLVLVVAANAMSGAAAGAASMLIMAAAVAVLGAVMIKLAEVPFGDLMKALGGIVLAIAALGLAAFLLQPVIPALLALGVALLAVGAAFALFGVGAYGVARAFQILSEAGPGAADAIVEALQAIGRAIPAVATGLAEGLLEFIRVIVEAAGPIAEALGVLLGHLLDTVEELLPKVGEVFLTLIETILEIIVQAYPQIIEAGIGLIIALLSAIEENIDDFVALGLGILAAFISGLAEGIPEIYGAVGELIAAFITAVGSFIDTIITAGVDMLIQFLSGITNNLVKITEAVGTMIITFIYAMAAQATAISQAGTDALVDFLEGITNNLYLIVEAVGTMITTLINAVAGQAQRIINAGAQAIIDFLNGIGAQALRIVAAGISVIIKFIEGLSSQGVRLANAAFDLVIDFLNALAAVIEQKMPELRAAGKRIAVAIADGLTMGLASKANDVLESGKSLGGRVAEGFGIVNVIRSPSKLFFKYGQFIVAGLVLGLEKDSAAVHASEDLAHNVAGAFQRSVAGMYQAIDSIQDFGSPTISPVLDMTQAMEQAKAFKDIIPIPEVMGRAEFAYSASQEVAKSPNQSAAISDSQQAGRGDVNFNQTINAPEQLSTSDIYKQTRNQITLAKDELELL